MARYYHYHTRRIAASLRLIALGLILCLFVFAIDSQLRPVIEAAEKARAKNYATAAVYRAVDAALQEAGADYGFFVTLSRDKSGRVTAIESNTLNVSRMQSGLALRVTQELEKLQYQELSIPLGNLTGIPVFSARGPQIPLKVAPYGFAEVEITNEFESAGINQTLHRVLMTTRVRITAAIPGFPVTTELVSSTVLAETVIVGEVPEFYADLTGSGRQLGAIYNLSADTML